MSKNKMSSTNKAILNIEHFKLSQLDNATVYYFGSGLDTSPLFLPAFSKVKNFIFVDNGTGCDCGCDCGSFGVETVKKHQMKLNMIGKKQGRKKVQFLYQNIEDTKIDEKKRNVLVMKGFTTSMLPSLDWLNKFWAVFVNLESCNYKNMVFYTTKPVQFHFFDCEGDKISFDNYYNFWNAESESDSDSDSDSDSESESESVNPFDNYSDEMNNYVVEILHRIYI